MAIKTEQEILEYQRKKSLLNWAEQELNFFSGDRMPDMDFRNLELQSRVITKEQAKELIDRLEEMVVERVEVLKKELEEMLA